MPTDLGAVRQRRNELCSARIRPPLAKLPHRSTTGPPGLRGDQERLRLDDKQPLDRVVRVDLGRGAHVVSVARLTHDVPTGAHGLASGYPDRKESERVPDPTLTALLGIASALRAIDRAIGRIDVRLQRLEAAAAGPTEAPEVRAARTRLEVATLDAKRGALSWLWRAPGRAWRWFTGSPPELTARGGRPRAGSTRSPPRHRRRPTWAPTPRPISAPRSWWSRTRSGLLRRSAVFPSSLPPNRNRRKQPIRYAYRRRLQPNRKSRKASKPEGLLAFVVVPTGVAKYG